MAKRNKQRRRLRKAATPKPRPLLAGTDAASLPETRAAMIQSDRLLRLVQFPMEVDSKLLPEPRVQDNWDVVAPAMLFSASSCLLSIRLLAETKAPRREQDAIVLLRRLYEHVVDFAWIAIDPTKNGKRWVADDYYHRLKIDDDFIKLGQPGLTPTNRTNFEQYVQANKRMPTMLDRAEAADRFWSPKITGHGVFPSTPPPAGGSIVSAQGGQWSLRTQYAVVYRLASGNAHPTPLSLATYVNAGSGTMLGKFTIGMNPHDHEDRYAYTFAPLIFATMLLVAEHVLGQPSRVDVEAAFRRERADAAGLV